MFTGSSRAVFFARRPGLTHALAIAVCLVCVQGDAEANVIDSGSQGFALVIEARIAAPPGEVYAALVTAVSQWWNPAHTFSGLASNLSIDARAGGCFCDIILLFFYGPLP